MKSLSYHKKLKAKGWEREELEWYLSDPGYLMMETEKIMSEHNIIYPVPFSIGFICKNHVQHVHPFILKILWNDSPEEGYAWNGYMEGFGEYRFVESKINPYRPTEEQLEEVRKFIRIFNVLFTAWWNGKLYSGYIIDYFYGNMSFNDLVHSFEDLKKKHIEGLGNCGTLRELKNYVREHKLWGLGDKDKTQKCPYRVEKEMKPIRKRFMKIDKEEALRSYYINKHDIEEGNHCWLGKSECADVADSYVCELVDKYDLLVGWDDEDEAIYKIPKKDVEKLTKKVTKLFTRRFVEDTKICAKNAKRYLKEHPLSRD